MNKKLPSWIGPAIILALNLVFTPASPAAITVLSDYRLGEDDPGAHDNGYMSSTTDSAGNNDLTVVGAPFWSADVSASASNHTASVFSFKFFDGGPYGTGPLLTTVTDNFGIEAWIKPSTTSGNHCIAYNGDTTANGWGLYQVGNTYRGRFAGVSIGSASVTLNGWTHLALVRANGVARLYVNGAAAGSSSSSVPVVPSGSFAIATPPQDHTIEPLAGWLDEVRVFTFASGQFSTSDLLVNSPLPPPTILAQSVTGVGGYSATFNATLNPRGQFTTAFFEYGTSTGYGNTTAGEFPAGSVAVGIHEPTVASLIPTTLYHFHTVASSAAGTSYGPDVTFTTPVGVPLVTTTAASNIGGTNATLNASINPGGGATTYYFEYGATTSYGNTTATNSLAAGTSPVSRNSTINGLFPVSTYHYRIVASNSAGVNRGSDISFTTVTANNITVTTTNDSGIGSLRVAISGAANPATINFAVTGTISLASALPIITNNLSINGPGAANLMISGSSSNRILFVDAAGGTVTVSNLTLANGLAKGGNGGYGTSGGGGGLGAGGALFVNAGNVIVSGVSFSNSAAIGGRGGDYNTNSPALGSGGGGGLNGDGGNGIGTAGAGGGGFAGRGGDALQGGVSAGGGGGGLSGNGATGADYAGGGGGGIGDGQSPSGNLSIGGAGGSGGGGKGGDYSSTAAGSAGQSGTTNGGGGGGGPVQNDFNNGGDGGAGGKFGGGGGAYGSGNAGAGGEFGGGGGQAFNGQYSSGTGGAGGFGAGGGGAVGGASGNGGFGGGSGGAYSSVGAAGPFGGKGAWSYLYANSGGGGGAALGGAIFVRATNGASLTLMDSAPDAGSVTAGRAGWSPCQSPSPNCGGAEPGSTSGSSIFLLGGTNSLTYNSGVSVISGSIGGWSNTPCVVIKNGAGTLVLAATNSYVGATVIDAGTLRVDGSIVSSSNVTVNSGGTLAGSGSVSSLTLNSGGTISPGASPGALNAGSTTWSGAGNYNWQVYDAAGAAGVGYDVLALNGTLNVSSASGFKINLWTLSSLSPETSGNAINFTNTHLRSWTLVQTTGGITGFNPANFIINVGPTNGTAGFANSLGAGYFTLSVVGNNLVLNFLSPPVATVQAASPITTTNATLNGIVNPAGLTTTYYFQYGTSTNYGTFSPTNTLGSTDNPLPVTRPIGSLIPGTVYHFSLVAANSAGTGSSSDMTFATPPLVPTISAQSANAVTTNGATLNASINPGNGTTTWYFQYGPTINYGSFAGTNSLSAGLSAIAISNAISGLLPGTIYHARAVAANSSGTTTGTDLSFTTLAAAPIALTQPATPVTSSNATLNASINPGGAATGYYFQYGLTTNYSAFTITNTLSAGASSVAVSNGITGLAPGTLYHFRAVAVNSAGLNFGADAEFSSLITSPDALTLAASSISSAAATLNATILPGGAPTTYYFQFGVTTNYGNFTPTNSLVAAGSALRFNGTNQSISTSQTINLSNASFSVEFWARRDGLNRYDIALLHGTNGVNSHTLHIGWRPSNVFTFAFWGDDLDTPAAYTDSGWHHWACTYDASTRNRFIYRDGIVVASGVAAANYQGIGPVVLALASPLGSWFGGSLDDVRIWSGVRTAGQIAASLNSQLSGTEAGLLANWKLDEAGGSVTADANGNGNTGTLVNAPAWLPAGASVAVANTISGLAPGTLYHARAVAANSRGTTTAADITFSTPTVLPTAQTLAATGVTSSNATLNALVIAGGAPTTYYWQYGFTTNYGAFTVTNSLVATGSGLHFNGTNQSVSTSQSINLINLSFSVEFWAKRDGINRSDIAMMQGFGTTRQTLHIGWRPSNVFTFGFWGDDLDTPVTYTDTDWHHWACTFDASTRNRIIYRDGIVVATGVAAGTYLGSDVVAIAFAAPLGTWFGGSLDDVRIWSGVRSAAQIAASLNSQLSGTEAGLLTNWKFDEGAGSVTADATGNGNTGTLINSPAWLLAGSPAAVSSGISGLLPGTLYHARAVAANINGNGTGLEVTFTTPALAPTVFTQPAAPITSSNATLNASINPGGAVTSYYFQYGLTTNYGSFTATNSTAASPNTVAVSNLLSSLPPGTPYHFRPVVSNSVATSFGADAQFVTPIAPAAATTLAAGSISSTGATLNGTVNPGGAPTEYYFQFGPTTNYGSFTATNSLVAAGSALRFNGSNQSVKTSQSVNLANTSFSIEFWARRAARNHSDFVVGQGTTGAPSQALHIGWRDSNQFTFAFWADDMDTPGVYTDTDWHHWACTYDGTTRLRYIYRDGIVVAFGLAAGNYLGSGPLTIAVSPPNGTWFGGSLDDVRVWSGVRSAAQIASGLNSQLSGTEAGLLVNWKFDEGNGSITGDATGNGNTGTLVNSPAWLPAGSSLAVSNAISGLLPGTQYHARLVALNIAGGGSGADTAFTTPAMPPTALTQAATDVARSNATLNATINPGGGATTYYFQYGLDTNYGSFTGTNILAAGLNPVSISNTVSGLSSATLYHARVIAANSSGNAAGADATFTTLTIAPVVLTQPATQINGGNATLNALISSGAAATYYFQYGPTTNYGSFTSTNSLAAGDSFIAVSNAVAGLQRGTLYHCQPVVWNSAGTNFGTDAEFATLITPPNATTLAAGGITSTGATVNASLDSGGAPTSYYFEYGATTNYGNFTPTNSFVAAGSGLHFNGTNQSVSTSQSINLANTSFSVEFWAKREALNRFDLVLGQGTNGVGQRTLHIGWRDNNHFTFAFWGNDLDTPTVYNDTDWHHWACTYDASLGNRFIYRDGILVASGGGAGLYQGSGPITIAAFAPLGTWFGGNLDDVRIWSGVRTAPQIAAALNSQLTGDEPGLLANWKFDEGSGSVTADATAGGNTGTLVQSPEWLPSVPNPANLTGLSPNTTYHFRAKALNAAGASSGLDLAFITPAADPSVTTLAASDITSSSATLNAGINPGGDIATNYFEYGLTTNYGSFSSTNIITAGTNPVTATAAINGLTPGTVYHFRAVAGDSARVVAGDDLTFTTAVLATPPTLQAAVLLPDGSFQFAFTNAPGIGFTVLATTDPALPASTWTVLGPATEVTPGQFQFTDLQATNYPQRFYNVRSP